ncbi:hypothetical protein GCM10027610_085160 [Dactylosporangium cerinum]
MLAGLECREVVRHADRVDVPAAAAAATAADDLAGVGVDLGGRRCGTRRGRVGGGAAGPVAATAVTVAVAAGAARRRSGDGARALAALGAVRGFGAITARWFSFGLPAMNVGLLQVLTGCAATVTVGSMSCNFCNCSKPAWTRLIGSGE